MKGGQHTWVPFAEIAENEAQLRRDDFVGALPTAARQRVAELEALDSEAAALEARFRKERRDLERKFEDLYAPVFQRRAKLVEALELDMQPVRQPHEGRGDFWLRAMKAHASTGLNIRERDEKALRMLRDVACRTLPEPEGSGFRLEFHFWPNEFFTNSVLSKTYYMSDSDTSPVLQRVVGTGIHWKPGRNLTIKHRTTHAASGRGKEWRAGPETQAFHCHSFFLFFATPRLPDPGDGDCFSEEFLRRVEGIEADYEVGVTFKDKIIPRAVRWFTGEATDDEEYEDDFGQEDDPDSNDSCDEVGLSQNELEPGIGERPFFATAPGAAAPFNVDVAPHATAIGASSMAPAAMDKTHSSSQRGPFSDRVLFRPKTRNFGPCSR